VRQKLPGESLLSYYNSTLKEKKRKEKFGNINFHAFVFQILQLIDVTKCLVNEINSFIDSVCLLNESMDIKWPCISRLYCPAIVVTL
jgi:hypothetical protein